MKSNLSTKSFFAVAVLSFSLMASNKSNAQIISTIAGNGTAGSSGDGVAATTAELHNPWGITTDPAGNIYFADYGNSLIRKISPAGVITTIAGGGTTIGDGGPATAALLDQPVSITFDSSGNLYIADSHNNRVRKVNTAGIITTIAGDGSSGYGGDGFPATSAQLWYPTGVAVDKKGNVYIAEEFNNRVRKIDASGTITTIAGTGATGYMAGGFSGDGFAASLAQINSPYGLFVDDVGNIYLADSYNNRIRKIDTSGIINTVVGGGSSGLGDGSLPTDATLNVPIAVSVDASGNMYISDGNNSRIRKVTSSSGIITTIAGTRTAGYTGDDSLASVAEINHPGAVISDVCGNVYIADWGNNRIRKVSSNICDESVSIVSGVEAFNVYPNPNTGAFTVLLTSRSNEPTDISITNILGQKITGYTGMTNQPADISLKVPPGIYFVTLSTQHGNWNTKALIR